jgi:hypothetical protein
VAFSVAIVHLEPKTMMPMISPAGLFFLFFKKSPSKEVIWLFWCLNIIFSHELMKVGFSILSFENGIFKNMIVG